MEESRSFVGDKRSLKRIFGDQAPGGQHVHHSGGQEQEADTQMCKYKNAQILDTQI